MLTAAVLFVFVALDDTFESFDFFAHGGFVGPFAEGDFLALGFFFKFSDLNSLFLDYSFELVNDGFELLSSAGFLVLEFNAVARLARERVSTEFFGVVSNLL